MGEALRDEIAALRRETTTLARSVGAAEARESRMQLEVATCSEFSRDAAGALRTLAALTARVEAAEIAEARNRSDMNDANTRLADLAARVGSPEQPSQCIAPSHPGLHSIGGPTPLA